MTHSTKVSLGIPCREQGRTALPEAVATAASAAAAAAAELGCIGKFKRDPVVAAEFTAGLVDIALGKNASLTEAGPVECLPHGMLIAAETELHK